MKNTDIRVWYIPSGHSEPVIGGIDGQDRNVVGLDDDGIIDYVLEYYATDDDDILSIAVGDRTIYNARGIYS